MEIYKQTNKRAFSRFSGVVASEFEESTSAGKSNLGTHSDQPLSLEHNAYALLA